MAVGLTLGKFAPLHKGHQALLDTALAENDQVIAIIYDSPAITSVPLPVRAAWLRDLYPQVEILEAWDAPQEVGDTPTIRAMHERYLAQLLAGRRIDNFYSGEFYGDHVSRALGAQDRRLDRAAIDISATRIRANPYQWRHMLHPRVYRDLICKVVLLGAPSTGKTTLAQALAAEYQTCWMPEYGREYWAQHQIKRRLSPAQLLEIATTHVLREEALLPAANRYLFVDTNALTTYRFAMYYHGYALPRLRELADAQRYQVTLLCATDIPYEDTWDRSGAANRANLQAQICGDLQARQIPYFSVHGTLAARVQQVREILLDR